MLRGLALALTLIAAVALFPATAATGRAPRPKIVSVADFYFAPSAVNLKKGGSVKWVWASFNAEPHDVHLKQGPRGLKQKGSYSTKTTAVTNARFQKKFETLGTYHYLCTLHPRQMKMTVKVTR